MFPDLTNPNRFFEGASRPVHVRGTVRSWFFTPYRALPGMMPADSGTSVLFLIDGEVQASPVQAWLLSPTGNVPVTVKGPWDGLDPLQDEVVVEFERGECIAPTTGWWRDRAEWLAGIG